MASLLPTLRGILTGVLMLLFIGIVAWAWSAARLPLEEDQPVDDGGEGTP